jgi:hypothetical protein
MLSASPRVSDRNGEGAATALPTREGKAEIPRICVAASWMRGRSSSRVRDRNKPRGRGGKLFGLAVPAVLVGLLAAYFANCIPGFGVPGQAPTTAQPQQSSAANDTKTAPADALELTVDGDRCRRGSEPAIACTELCTALGTEPNTRKILVQATLGTHAAVDALRKCLDGHGFRDVVVRTE